MQATIDANDQSDKQTETHVLAQSYIKIKDPDLLSIQMALDYANQSKL